MSDSQRPTSYELQRIDELTRRVEKLEGKVGGLQFVALLGAVLFAAAVGLQVYKML